MILYMASLVLSLGWLQTAGAAPISPWTGQPYPSTLQSPSIPLKISFDSQLSDRSALLWMKYVDWEKVQETATSGEDGERWGEYVVKNYSADYISTKVQLDWIQQIDPQLHAELIDGLNLTPANLIVQQQIPVRGPTEPLRAKGGLILPSAQDMEQLRIPRADANTVSDWRLLNNRWNQLPTKTKHGVFSWRLLSSKTQVLLLRDLKFMRILGSKAGDTKNFFTLYGKDMPEKFSNIQMSPEIAFEGPISAGLEFRLQTPETEPMQFLDLLHAFNAHSNRLYYIQNPSQRGQFADGDFHIHISLPHKGNSRAQDLKKIAQAWNHLALLKEIELGNVGWNNDSATGGGFSVNVRIRGYVRLVEPYHLEIRNQIFAPQQTLEYLIYLFQVDDNTALDFIYQKLAPPMTQDRLMEIFTRNPKLYDDLVSTPAFLKSLSFQPSDSAFRTRVLEYFKAKANNAEYVATSRLKSWMSESEIHTHQSVFRERLFASPSETKMQILIKLISMLRWEDLDSTLGTLPLETAIEISEIYLQGNGGIFYDHLSTILAPHLEGILKWYGDRARTAQERDTDHAKFIRQLTERFISRSSHEQIQKVLPLMDPIVLSLIFRQQGNAYESSDLFAGFDDYKLQQAIKRFLDDAENGEEEWDYNTNLADFILSWVRRSKTLERGFFSEMLQERPDLLEKLRAYFQRRNVFMGNEITEFLNSNVPAYARKLSRSSCVQMLLGIRKQK